VRTYLSQIESRAAGKITLSSEHKNHHKHFKSAIQKGVERARGGEDGGNSKGKGGKKGNGEEVVLKATGKAIERLLQVALFFENEEGVKVEIRTGSVGAVDDVVEREGGGETGESRVRRTSCLEVWVRLV
jgi:ribonuclease P/MRP protein subunit POP7